MQAEAFCDFFGRERSELAVHLAELVRLSTSSMRSETDRPVAEIRRDIRRVETEMRQIDRMVDNLEHRFTDARISRRA